MADLKIIFSLDASRSYFHVIPPRVDDRAILYEKTCYCESRDDNVPKRCEDAPNELNLPGIDRNLATMKMLHVRQKERRDVSRSDALSEEDYEYFKEPDSLKRSLHGHQRTRREAKPFPVSRENATKYCVEKLVESHVGKFCAKLGINVHSFVNVCSADIMVNMKGNYKTQGPQSQLKFFLNL